MDRQLNSLELLAEVCQQLVASEEAERSQQVINTTIISTASITSSLSSNNQPVTGGRTSNLPEFTNDTKVVLCRWLKENDNNQNPYRDAKIYLARSASITYDQVSDWFRSEREKARTTSAIKRFSPSQVEILESSFKKNRYPDKEEKVLLASQLGSTETQVESWFHNIRRYSKPNSVDGSPIICGPLTAEQMRYLEKWFDENNQNLSPSPAERREQAVLIGTSLRRINGWFYSRRRKTITKKTSCVTFSATSLKTLEKSFKSNAYPERATKENLATTLRIPIKSVTKWFENRRRKEKQLDFVRNCD